MTDIVERIKTVFDDNDEVVSWCDRSTYEGAETYTHLIGLYDAALEAADEITRLRAENERLREALVDIANTVNPYEDGDQMQETARAALKGEQR